MKPLNLLSLIILFLFNLPALTNGQTEKGKILFGGDTDISVIATKNINEIASTYTTESKSRIFKFTPEIGFFPWNNVAVGLAIRYEKESIKQGNDSYSSSSFYTLPLLQIYFSKEVMKPYIYGALGLGKTQSDYTYSPDDNEKKLRLGEVGCGLAMFVNESVSFEIGGAYSSIKSIYDDNSGIDNIDKVKGLGFQIGIVLCL